MKNTGQTKSNGWQFGIRKSFPIKIENFWNKLFSKEGMHIWLKDAELNFSTEKVHSHIRTKWKLRSWPNKANLQMRVIENKHKTTLAFHIDNLLDINQRIETEKYWKLVIEDIQVFAIKEPK